MSDIKMSDLQVGDRVTVSGYVRKKGRITVEVTWTEHGLKNPEVRSECFLPSEIVSVDSSSQKAK